MPDNYTKEHRGPYGQLHGIRPPPAEVSVVFLEALKRGWRFGLREKNPRCLETTGFKGVGGPLKTQIEGAMFIQCN